MGVHENELFAELTKMSDILAQGDQRVEALERSVNEILRKAGRPGGIGQLGDGADLERKSAIEMCKIRHDERVPKSDDVTKAYTPSSQEIDEALAARRALSHVIRKGGMGGLDAAEQKSLSAFSFGSPGGFLLPPERMAEVLSCIVYPTDLGGLFDSVNISGPSAVFLLDNPRMGLGAWACESSCFSNNPQPDLAEGLGQLEIKPETIRMVACATRDLIEDASMNFESWLFRKIGDGMRATINNSLILGDGVGKPMGLLNPRAGIPICETAPATPAGFLSWQDVYMLKWEIPMQWQEGASFLCNQRTWAQIMTLSDATGRPLWSQAPGGEPGLTLAGSPVHIATQFPDIAPGSTPIAYGNWRRAFTIVWRKGVTLQVDPYSASFCWLYKAEARVGGGVTCGNAARLLRIR